MDPRLEEAAYAGNVSVLCQLIEQNRLLLHQPKIVRHPTNNPLHIAALHGHAEFAREVLARNPELACAINGQGLSPLDLASAIRHISVVRELVYAVGPDLCLLHDKDGLLPIHTAAMKGRVCVLRELMNACSESALAQTCLEDSILHLVVSSNCFEIVKFLVDRFDQEGDHELLKSKDAKGNTILHLATGKKAA